MENAKLLTKEYFERDREVQELIAKNHSLSQENAGLKRRLGDQERNK
jgi:regulator of replication initiation timing